MQEDKAPKVSVCITTYNHEKFIKEAIDSVLAQETNFNYDIVISDDFSTDKTQEILKKYQQAYPDKIHLMLNKINVGAIKNFNQALKACKGEYIAILDGD
ncbi:MAG: glycosyltransferase family 2 protein, partial [bacterium]